MNIQEIKIKYFIDAISGKEAADVLNAQAPALLKMLNRRLGAFDGKPQFKIVPGVRFSDGWHLRLTTDSGKWTDETRRLNYGMSGTSYKDVVYKRESYPAIFLAKSWRPESHRGVVVKP